MGSGKAYADFGEFSNLKVFPAGFELLPSRFTSSSHHHYTTVYQLLNKMDKFTKFTKIQLFCLKKFKLHVFYIQINIKFKDIDLSISI
jgi:hypothetical protein